MVNFTANTNSVDWTMLSAFTGVYAAVSVLLAAIANKIFKFGQTSEKIRHLEATLEKDIKPEISTISHRVDDLFRLLAANSVRVDDLFKLVANGKVSESHSPRQLNAEGKKILATTDIKAIIDGHYSQIVQFVRSQKPENAYEAEQAILDAIADLAANSRDIQSDIETAAYATGTIPYLIMTVGGLYVRDKVFMELNLSPRDIDPHIDG